MAGVQQLMWVEKYRPSRLEDVVNQRPVVERLASMLKAPGEIPHLLFAGPPGTGKCVSSDTEVLTPYGEPVRILDIPDNKLVTVLADGKVVPGEFSNIYVSEVDVTVTLKTRTGRTVRCTSEHHFPVLGDNKVLWKPAFKIQKGDRILVAAELPEILEDRGITEIDVIEALRPFSNKIIVELEGLLAEKYGRRIELSKILEEPKELLRSSMKSLAYDYKQVNHGSRYSQPVKPVWKITPELLEIVGYLQSEGSSWDRFTNGDPKLVKRLRCLLQKVFGLKLERIPRTKYDYHVKKAIIYKIIMDYVFGEFTKQLVPSTIMKAATFMVPSYLRAFFDGDGWTEDRGIFLSQKHERIVRDIAVLLLRLGIFSRLRRRKQPFLEICSRLAKIRFLESIGLTDSQKVARVNVTTFGFEDFVPIDLCRIAHIAVQEHIKNARIAHGQYSQWLVKNRFTAVRRIELLSSCLLRQESDLIKVAQMLDQLLRPAKTQVIFRIESKLRQFEGKGRRLHLLASTAAKYASTHQVLDDSESGIVNSHAKICEAARIAMAYLTTKEARVGSLLKSNSSRLPKLFNYARRLRRAIRNRLILVEKAKQELAKAAIIVSSPFVYDQVVAVKKVKERHRVVDLVNATNHSFVLANGIVAHNTTVALCIAKSILSDYWRDYTLELNASDERGISTVRERVKVFARYFDRRADVPFRIIILDEADEMTGDAQTALRRIMEESSRICRFILICNYSSGIIEPIQSRCSVFRFSRLEEEDMVKCLERICARERVKHVKQALQLIYEVSGGDLRQAINLLQASSVLGEVNSDNVMKTAGLTGRSRVGEVVRLALKGEFHAAREKLLELTRVYGMPERDFLKYASEEVFGLNLPNADEAAEVLAKYDYRLIVGAHPDIQLVALLAELERVGRNASVRKKED